MSFFSFSVNWHFMNFLFLKFSSFYRWVHPNWSLKFSKLNESWCRKRTWHSYFAYLFPFLIIRTWEKKELLRVEYQIGSDQKKDQSKTCSSKVWTDEKKLKVKITVASSYTIWNSERLCFTESLSSNCLSVRKTSIHDVRFIVCESEYRVLEL